MILENYLNLCGMKNVLRLVATLVFNMRLLHAIAFSKKLLWLAQTNVISFKTQTHAVNASWKHVSQLGFNVVRTCILNVIFLFFS